MNPVPYRYVDAENEALRMRLTDARTAAREIKFLIGGNGYLKKSSVKAIYERLDLIINGKV
jgi:inhibitor of KinA sporulation pathway (predicted exonuclease)